LVLVKHDIFATRSTESAIPKIHRYHPGPGENSHLSLVDEMSKIARFQTSNNIEHSTQGSVSETSAGTYYVSSRHACVSKWIALDLLLAHSRSQTILFVTSHVTQASRCAFGYPVTVALSFDFDLDSRSTFPTTVALKPQSSRPDATFLLAQPYSSTSHLHYRLHPFVAFQTLTSQTR
jgi:hypothetical protein